MKYTEAHACWMPMLWWWLSGLGCCRDLKPANLMISGNLHADVEQLYLDSGVVKVADFGLSKSLVPVDRHGQMSMSLTQVGAAAPSCSWLFASGKSM